MDDNLTHPFRRASAADVSAVVTHGVVVRPHCPLVVMAKKA
jgi:hypothetical protein